MSNHSPSVSSGTFRFLTFFLVGLLSMVMFNVWRGGATNQAEYIAEVVTATTASGDETPVESGGSAAPEDVVEAGSSADVPEPAVVAPAPEPEPAPVAAPVDGWVRETSTDDFDGARVQTWCVTSTQETNVSFSSPYPEGPQGARLCLRQRGTEEVEAYVALERGGQFSCSVRGCQADTLIGLAEGELLQGTLGLVRTASGNNDVVFVAEPSAFIRSIQDQERLRARFEFYRSGYHTFEWNPVMIGERWFP